MSLNQAVEQPQAEPRKFKGRQSSASGVEGAHALVTRDPGKILQKIFHIWADDRFRATWVASGAPHEIVSTKPQRGPYLPFFYWMLWAIRRALDGPGSGKASSVCSH